METILSAILIFLLLLIILGLFSKKKHTSDIDVSKIVRVRDDMNEWFSCMQSYMNVIGKYQKDINKLELTLTKLNRHFIMSNDEIEKHFPAVHNKVHLKPKLTLVKMKKEIDKLTKKEKKNGKPKK